MTFFHRHFSESFSQRNMAIFIKITSSNGFLRQFIDLSCFMLTRCHYSILSNKWPILHVLNYIAIVSKHNSNVIIENANFSARNLLTTNLNGDDYIITHDCWVFVLRSARIQCARTHSIHNSIYSYVKRVNFLYH